MANEVDVTLLPTTDNEMGICAGSNLPNNSASLRGFPKYITSMVTPRGQLPLFRTKQEALRVAAWLVLMADHLDTQQEAGNHTFEQILEAIKNS